MSILSTTGRANRRATKASSPIGSASNDAAVRTRLAVGIVSLGLIGVSALAITILLKAPDPNQYQAAQLVLTAALPLFGTWVGTVLAFYFAKGNLEAATDSTLRLSGQISRDSPVEAAMIPKASIIARSLAAGQDPSAVTVESLHTLMKAVDKKRVPVLDDKGVVIWVVHESLLLSFASKANKPLSDPTIQASTLANILADTEFKALAGALAFVPVSATIATARERLQAVPGCNDVFVTRSGSASDPVVGWLTNTMLASVE